MNDCSDHAVVFPFTDRRYRPRDLEAGDTCVYDANGQQVRLDKNGVRITAKDGKPVEITGPSGISLKNDTEITGTAKATAFQTGEGDGFSGTVTYLKDLSGNTGTLTFSGGILIAST